MTTRGEEGPQASRCLHELCSILLAFLSPSPAGDGEGPRRSLPSVLHRLRLSQASPAAVASLLLGVSMALMLGGSVTFVLGFMLMPWVLGMLTLLYVAGVVSSLSALGRAFLFPRPPPPQRRSKATCCLNLQQGETSTEIADASFSLR